MELVVLHIDDCPSRAEAERRVHAALDALGRDDIAVGSRLITTPAEAAAAGFAGSPTILADGVDVFPGEPTVELACRVYRTPTGFAGAPTVDMIAEALRGRLAGGTGAGTLQRTRTARSLPQPDTRSSVDGATARVGSRNGADRPHYHPIVTAT